MIKREDYLTIIEEIRNTDKKSIDEFIAKILEPIISENENFIEILYKDIYYLIEDIDKNNTGILKFNDFITYMIPYLREQYKKLSIL